MARKAEPMRMPTFRADRRTGPGEAGFTLVELLAVLTLLSLAIAAFAFRAGSSFDSADFRSLMVRTAAGLREARSDAIVNHREQVFVVNTARRRMISPVSGTVLAIPPDVDLTVIAAQPETMADGTAGIRFYADGSSSGGTLSFSWNGRKYGIDVNWLTGNVALNGL